jgi:hypothetical protein
VIATTPWCRAPAGGQAVELAQRPQLDGDAGGAGGVDQPGHRVFAPGLGALASGVEDRDRPRSGRHQLAHRADPEDHPLGHGVTSASSAAIARGGGRRIGGVADRSTDHDQIGAVGARRARRRDPTLIAGLGAHRADAGRDDQEVARHHRAHRAGLLRRRHHAMAPGGGRQPGPALDQGRDRSRRADRDQVVIGHRGQDRHGQDPRRGSRRWPPLPPPASPDRRRRGP